MLFGVPSAALKPRSLSALPIGQKPVKATLMDTRPVATTPKIHSGLTSTAKSVLAISTRPAISHTVRSMYQRSVGTT